MNAYVMLAGSSVALFLLGLVHYIYWRFKRELKRMSKRVASGSKPLPMPVVGTADGEPGKVYARVKHEFENGNEAICEMPLIYLISEGLSFEFSDIREMLAKCYLAKNQPKKAEIALFEAIKEGPFNIKVYVLLSEVYIKQKKIDDAFELLKSASEEIVNPNEIWQPLANLARKLKKDEDLLKALNEMLRMDPKNEDIEKEIKKIS